MARSALINVMVNAALKAGRGLARDFGEVENLQVSLKGPGDFVSAADHRADQVLIAELQQGPSGLWLPHRGERRDPRRRHAAIAGSSIRSTAPPISSTASRSSPSRSALEREGQRGRRRRLQSDHERALRRRARRRRLPQRSAPARRRPQASRRRRDRDRHTRRCGVRRRCLFRRAADDHGRGRRRSPRPARRPSTSPGSPPAGSTASGITACRPGTSPAASILVREAGGFVTDATGGDDSFSTGSIVAGNEEMHRQVVALLAERSQAAARYLTPPPFCRFSPLANHAKN